MGDGSPPGSLSHAGIRRPIGCQLPDAILHGKRSLRPRSRAVQGLSASGLLSEAFQLASADDCATGLRTRQRHVCDSVPRLYHLAPGRPLLSQRVCPVPRVSPLNSQVAFCSQFSGNFFDIADFRKLSTGFATASCASRYAHSFCLAFRRL